MNTAKRPGRIRILALCPSGDSAALVRRALFACGEVELLAVAAGVDDVLQRAAESAPDLVLVALGQKIDHQALLDGLALLGVAVAGLRERGPTRQGRAHRDAAGLPVLTMPITFDQLSMLVAAHRRRAAQVPSPGASTRALDRLIVRSRGFVQLLPVSEIVWIEALHNAVRLHTLAGESRLRMSISALARELAPERFVRIHRSHIVNLDHVTQFRVSAQGQYSALTKEGRVLNVGRTFQGNLLLRLQRA